MSIAVYVCRPGEVGAVEEWPVDPDYDEEQGLEMEPQYEKMVAFFKPCLFEAVVIDKALDIQVSDNTTGTDLLQYNFHGSRVAKCAAELIGLPMGPLYGNVMIVIRNEEMKDRIRTLVNLLRKSKE